MVCEAFVTNRLDVKSIIVYNGLNVYVYDEIKCLPL